VFEGWKVERLNVHILSGLFFDQPLTVRTNFFLVNRLSEIGICTLFHPQNLSISPPLVEHITIGMLLVARHLLSPDKRQIHYSLGVRHRE
jgi:hypothetical protein